MLENLNTLANLVQLASYEELLKQATNDDLFEELQRQNHLYLERILANQKSILKQLEVIYEINKGNTYRDI